MNDVWLDSINILKNLITARNVTDLQGGQPGSGKSVDIAQDFILKLSDTAFEGCNLLVCRKTEDTNRDSTFAELQGAVFRIFGEYAKYAWKITKSPLMMENLQTGSQIIFRGMYDEKQREKIKSITFKKGKLTWIWLEEATEFLESDVDILDDRLRGRLDNPNLFYQITFSFNPVSAAHWLKSKYFDINHPDVFTHHSTYLQNRFIDEAYHRRMMMRKERDPEGYKVYGLGDWGELGGLILTNYKIMDFDTHFDNFSSMYNGIDFGFNHATAMLEIGARDNDIYVCKELYEYEKTMDDIIRLAEGKFNKELITWCDSAEPDRIEMMRRAGYYRAEGVKKSPNMEQGVLAGATKKTYINSQVDWLKQRTIYIHPSCINLQKEISQWKWQKDDKTNQYIDQPVDIFDDAIAALRYGCSTLIQRRTSLLDVL